MILALALALLPQQEPVDFPTEVLPILKSRCFSCHAGPENGGPARPKGRLRLDGPQWLEAGVRGRAIHVAGHKDQSTLFSRLDLPADDLDLMPPDDGPLPAEQIELIGRWLDEGARFGDWEGAARTEVAAEKADPESAKPPRIARLEALAEGLAPLPQNAVRKAAATSGATIEPILPGSPLLRVSFVSRRHETGDDAVTALAAVRLHVTHLDLARTHIGDAALERVAAMPRLTHLDLGRTGITDRGLRELAGLEHLEVLNLHGTKVRNGVVDVARGLGALRALYLWGVELDPAATRTLATLLPDVRVVGTIELPEPPRPATDDGPRRR